MIGRRLMAAVVVLATAHVFAAGSAAAADLQTKMLQCGNPDATPDTQVKGCTTLIEVGLVAASDEALSTAYTARGGAHLQLQAFEHAISDFERALRLNPQNTTARKLRDYAERNKSD